MLMTKLSVAGAVMPLADCSTMHNAALLHLLDTPSAPDGDRIALVAGVDADDDWIDQWRPDDRPSAAAALAEARRCGTAREMLVASHGGQATHWDVRLNRLPGYGAVIAIARDVTATVREITALETVAYRDGLTGLHNRNALRQQLNEAIVAAAANGGSVSLLMLDLDNFKLINDTLGHDAGDALLIEAANRLRITAGDEAIAGRLGGDEFAVIAFSPDTHADSSPLAEALLEAMRRPVNYKGKVLDTRVSIGVATFPHHASDAAGLFKSADIALYSAKSFGRGSFTTYVSSMGAAVQRRAAAIEALRDAMANDRVSAWYQPKVDFASLATTGFEAVPLAYDSDGKRISAATVQRAAEDIETARQLSEMVFDHVAYDVAAWVAAGKAVPRIAINVTAAEFRSGDYARRFLERLAAHGLSPALFEVGVAENILNGRGLDHICAALHSLAAAGVAITLQNCGAGGASFSLLKDLPLSGVKIDRRFVNGMLDNEGDQAVVHAIICMVSVMQQEVVASGVDTLELMQTLEGLGCIAGQGDWAGATLTAAAVQQILGAIDAQPLLSSAN